jgi:glycosyltransferase involved in cell wall biosynthesis
MHHISVIIPLYNKARYIARAIESVVRQTINVCEIVIIDDGSTDDGVLIARAINTPIMKIVKQENSGVSLTRNNGIQLSQGEYVAFLDADDEWHPNFLESIAKIIKNYPNAGIYATAYEKLRPNGNRAAARYKYIPPPPWEGILPSYFKAAAYGDPPVCASAVCVPRKVFDKVGLFNEGRRMGEDLDLWGRIALHYPVAFTWKTGAIYHEEAQNRACNVKFTEADEHPFIETINSMRKEEQLAAHNKDIDLYIGRLKLENARQHVISGNYGRARQLLSSGVSTPSEIRKLLWGSHINRLTHLAWVLKCKGYC